MQRIIYLMDNVNYAGGAHKATFNQISFMHETGRYQICIATLHKPSQKLENEFHYISFIHPSNSFKMVVSPKKLLRVITPQDIVCIPFENSIFRQYLPHITCKCKIQWIHIDYAHWRALDESQAITAHDEDIYSHFDIIVFVSLAAKNGFVAIYPSLSSKCIVCHNLLGEQKALVLAQHKAPAKMLPKETYQFVTVTRFDNVQKAILRYVLIANLLKNNVPNFKWFFAGDGPERETFLHLVHLFDLEDNIIWVGQVDNPYVYMKNADLFILCSLYEGIPNTVFESMIVGTPVLATKVSGTGEQLQNGGGWLVDNDIYSIVRQLTHLCKLPALLSAQREWLQTYHYNEDTIKKRMEAIFSSPALLEKEMMHTVTVSVIVPIYNVEEYLPQCLDSLATQTLDSIECILVDDGSTDSSTSIAKQYAEKNPERFQYYYKDNGGLGSARNYGLSKARGSHVAFIDSDDWVDANTFKDLLHLAGKHDCDIVLGDLYGYNQNTGQSAVEHCPFKCPQVIDKQELIQFSTRPVVVSACTKLYRRDILANFSFPSGWYEDLASIPILFSNSNRVYYTGKPFYHYRWNRSGSIQNQKDQQRTTAEIIRAQQNVLDNVNPAFLAEASFSIYEHCCRHIIEYPQALTAIQKFVQKNITNFTHNEYILPAIQQNNLPQLWIDESNIPLTIHYGWFGPEPKSSQENTCIASWKTHMPQYQITEWGQSNFDIQSDPTAKSAYEKKDWNFLNIYVPLLQISRQGGLALNPQMLLHSSLVPYLSCSALFSFENYYSIMREIVACEPDNAILQKMLTTCFSPTLSLAEIGQRTSTFLTEEYRLQPSGITQVLPGGIVVQAANYLALNCGDGLCAAEWMPTTTADTRKQSMLESYFVYPVLMNAATGTTTTDTPIAGNRYKVTDHAIEMYGIRFVLRQTGKAILKKVLPTKRFQSLESRYLNYTHYSKYTQK